MGVMSDVQVALPRLPNNSFESSKSLSVRILPSSLQCITLLSTGDNSTGQHGEATTVKKTHPNL